MIDYKLQTWPNIMITTYNLLHARYARSFRKNQATAKIGNSRFNLKNFKVPRDSCNETWKARVKQRTSRLESKWISGDFRKTVSDRSTTVTNRCTRIKKRSYRFHFRFALLDPAFSIPDCVPFSTRRPNSREFPREPSSRTTTTSDRC